MFPLAYVHSWFCFETFMLRNSGQYKNQLEGVVVLQLQF